MRWIAHEPSIKCAPTFCHENEVTGALDEWAWRDELLSIIQTGFQMAFLSPCLMSQQQPPSGSAAYLGVSFSTMLLLSFCFLEQATIIVLDVNMWRANQGANGVNADLRLAVKVDLI